MFQHSSGVWRVYRVPRLSLPFTLPRRRTFGSVRGSETRHYHLHYHADALLEVSVVVGRLESTRPPLSLPNRLSNSMRFSSVFDIGASHGQKDCQIRLDLAVYLTVNHLADKKTDKSAQICPCICPWPVGTKAHTREHLLHIDLHEAHTKCH